MLSGVSNELFSTTQVLSEPNSGGANIRTESAIYTDFDVELFQGLYIFPLFSLHYQLRIDIHRTDRVAIGTPDAWEGVVVRIGFVLSEDCDT